MDQNITYRVNVDDSNFNSKLTQMRASLDATMGGGGGGGFSANMMYGAMGMFGGGSGGGGVSDFGSQIRPVTFTPPAIAMTPHFGMYQVNQTLTQAGLATMGGPMGASFAGGFRGSVPENISVAEYRAMSARGFGDRVGDATAIAALTAGSTAGSLMAGGVGAAAGASLFTGGLMRGLGGLVGGAVGGTLVSEYTGAVVDMMADNRQNQSALASGSFRFFNGPANEVDQLTGRGMGRRTRANVATSIQGMEMNDLRYGMDEYKQVLEGGMQYDLFSGTQGTEDFKTKFKGLVENLKTVTSTLHTSLKEGIEVIRGFRDMGVTDPSEVNRLVMSSEARGRSSGRTGQEMLAIGQTGAEQFRGTGIAMSAGFELNQMNASSVRFMLNAGTLSRESIAQAGGENALAQQMTAGALASFQTSYGRAAMMANYNPAAGPSGAMNPNMINNLASSSLMNQISGAANMDPASMLKFQAHQEDMISSMGPGGMQAFGIASRSGMAREFMRFGLNFEDAYRVSGQREGMSKPQIDADIGMLHTNVGKMRENNQLSIDTMARQAGEEDIRNRFNIGKRISNSVRRTIVSPVSNALTSLSTSVGESVDNIALSLSGSAVVDKGLLSKDLIEGGNRLLGAEDSYGAVDVGGSTYQRLIGGQTGSAFIDAARSGASGIKVREFASLDEARAAGIKDKTRYDVSKGSDGKYYGVTDADVKRQVDSAKSMQFSAADSEEAGKEDVDVKIGAKLVAVGKAGGGIDAAMGAIFGDDKLMGDLRSLSSEDFQKKYKNTKGHYTARADNYFKTFGSRTPEAVKQFRQALNSTGASDLTASERAKIGEEGSAAASELIKGLGSVNGAFGLGSSGTKVRNGSGESGDAKDILSHNEAALAELMGADTDDDKIAKLAKMTGGYDFGDLVSQVNSDTNKERRARRTQLSETVQKKAAMANNLAQSTQGAGGPGAAGIAGQTLGDISVDQSKAIADYAAQLYNTLKLVEGIQKNIVDRSGKK